MFARILALGAALATLSACSGMSSQPPAGHGTAPLGVSATAGSGYLYYIAHRHGRVVRVTLPGGDALESSDPDGGRRTGTGLAVDAEQNVYESYYFLEGGSGVCVYDSDLHLLRTFTPSTGGTAFSIAVDSSGLIYLGLYMGQSQYPAIEVFAADASGSAVPIRTISGPLTFGVTPADLKVNASGELFAALGQSILVFAAGANGDEPPVRQISGTLTKLATLQIALGADGNIYVANFVRYNTGEMLVFPQTANGNVAPLRELDSHPYGASVALGPGGVEFLGPGPLRGRNGNQGFAMYPPGATGKVPPSGFVGMPITNRTLPSAIALGNPWTR